MDDTGHVLRVLSVTTGISYTYTNLATGQTVTTRAGGSAISSEMNPDGTWTYTATGHNGLILFPSDIPAGPTTTVYEGRIIFRVDPGSGLFTLVSTNGRSRDICAELSSS